jgi:hypothetical protein
MRNRALINAHMVHEKWHGAACHASSPPPLSVYFDMAPGAPEMGEGTSYLASPDIEYGWENCYGRKRALRGAAASRL